MGREVHRNGSSTWKGEIDVIDVRGRCEGNIVVYGKGILENRQ